MRWQYKSKLWNLIYYVRLGFYKSSIKILNFNILKYTFEQTNITIGYFNTSEYKFTQINV